MMSEQEKRKLEYLENFYYAVWGSGWISTDTTYEIAREIEQRLGFDARGNMLEQEEAE